MKARGSWTRKDVEARLVAAFRALPHSPVYARGRTIRPIDGDSNSLTEVLNWDHALSHEPAARTYLWAWARCRARHDSFGDLCRGMNWPRATAEDGRRRAAAILVKHLNGAAKSTENPD